MVTTFKKEDKNILLFIKLPPPLTGATLMNKYVNDSNLLKNKFRIKTIPISYKNQINSKFEIYKFFKIIRYHILLIKELVLFKPRLVYFQISPLGYAFIRDCTYIVWLKIFNVHTIYHLHGKGIKEVVNKSKFQKNLYRWAFKNSSVICLSKLLVDDISDVYLSKPYIVNNGIPNIKIESSKRKNKSKVQVLLLSNLIYSKGIISFLDSIALISKSSKNRIEVKIVGSEVEISKSKLNYELTKRNINELVEFLGPKYNEEKENTLLQTDILVFPTLNDVWGLVIIEAMQFGIPVIATREGAIPEIVDDGITGFLVDKNSPEQIAEKLKILLENHDLRYQMGVAARKKFQEKYTLEIFEKNMLNVFTEISKSLE